MRFCSGLPMWSVGIKPPWTKPWLYWISLLGTVLAPWASIQTSASLSPVRVTFYLDGPFRWKSCCVRFYVISSLSQKFQVQGSFVTLLSWIFTTSLSQGILAGHKAKEWSLSAAWFLPKDTWRTSLLWRYWITNCCFTCRHCCSTRQ